MTGETIRTRRVAARLTQEQLATMLGVTTAAVCNWETGDAHARTKYAVVMEYIFSVHEKAFRKVRRELARVTVQ